MEFPAGIYLEEAEALRDVGDGAEEAGERRHLEGARLLAALQAADAERPVRRPADEQQLRAAGEAKPVQRREISGRRFASLRRRNALEFLRGRRALGLEAFRRGGAVEWVLAGNLEGAGGVAKHLGRHRGIEGGVGGSENAGGAGEDIVRVETVGSA